MKITTEQLSQQLRHKPLASVYCVSGNEMLLVQEAMQLIRQVSQQAGFTERNTFHVEAHFDWQSFLMEASSLSLFSQASLLELKFSNEKLPEIAKKSLTHYLKNLPRDKILLIQTPTLDSKEWEAEWCHLLEKIGVFVNARSITLNQFPQWLGQRAKQKNLSIDTEGIRCLTELTEGNLLAADQALEKLTLLFPNQSINRLQVLDAAATSSHYSLFDCVDVTLQGDLAQIKRILSSLQAESIEPILLVWALCRELRNLINMQEARQQGLSFEHIFQQYRVWEKRKTLIKLTLQRHSHQDLLRLLQQGATLDRIVKGGETGNIWQNLLQWCWRIAAKKFPLDQ